MVAIEAKIVFLTCKTALKVIINHLTSTGWTDDNMVLLELRFNQSEEMSVVNYSIVI
jgi:hypothetical protein